MHSEAKPTEMEFGAKFIAKGKQRTGSSCYKDPNSLVVSREVVLQAKFGGRAAGCVTFL